MSEEFENEVRVFTLKTHQMFSVHTAPEKFDNLTITVHFRFFLFRKTGEGKSRDYRDDYRFPSTQKRKAGVITFLRFEERFRKAPFL